MKKVRSYYFSGLRAFALNSSWMSTLSESKLSLTSWTHWSPFNDEARGALLTSCSAGHDQPRSLMGSPGLFTCSVRCEKTTLWVFHLCQSTAQFSNSEARFAPASLFYSLLCFCFLAHHCSASTNWSSEPNERIQGCSSKAIVMEEMRELIFPWWLLRARLELLSLVSWWLGLGGRMAMSGLWPSRERDGDSSPDQ